MEPRRGGRRGGNSNRGGGYQRRGNHGPNYPGFENDVPHRHVDGRNRSYAEPTAGGRGRGQQPAARSHRPARRSGSNTGNRGFRQGLSLEDIAAMEGRGSNLRRNEGLYGSSQSVQSARGGNASGFMHADRNRRHSQQQVVYPQKNRKSEILFGGMDAEDELGDADSSWVTISSRSKTAYEDDNASVYSTDSGDTFNSAQNGPYYSSSPCTGARSKCHEKSVAPLVYEYPKIAIYWDIENCPLPSAKSAIRLVKKIRDTFCANTHTEDEFVVVCDTSNQKKELLDQLTAAQVDVQHINATSKNASDDMLRRKMNDFADRSHPPAKVVLITGDINFGPDIYKLNYKRHFKVVLLHNRQASEALRMHANKCISYESFCEDIATLQDAATVTERVASVLEVSNLPRHAPENKIRERLYHLLSPFGGKVVKLSHPPHTANVKFAALSDARRAQPRLEGADVQGNKICVRFTNSVPNESNSQRNNRGSRSRRDEDANTCTGPKEEPSPQKQEQQDSPIGNACTIRFVVGGVISIKDLTQKLQPLQLHDNITVLPTQNEQTCCIIKVASLAKAKKTVKCLKSLKTLTVLSTDVLKGKENDADNVTTGESAIMSDMQKLRNNFSKMKQHYIDRHEAEAKTLKNKLWELREQMSSCDNDPMLESHEKAIISQLNVLSDVQKEFETKTEQLITVSLRSKHDDATTITGRITAECHQFVSATPIYALRSTIVAKVLQDSFVIVSGPPGMSKSTQVVQCLFHAEVCSSTTTLACTQPYPELVTDHGTFVASQMRSAVGRQVAFYKARKTAPGNQLAQIMFLPDYILLDEALDDPKLKNYSCIVVDEAQQRSLATEMLLVYLEQLVKLRKELKVVILSTPERASVLRRRLSRSEEVSLTVTPYPVDIIWRSSSDKQNHIEACVKMAMQLHLSEDTGDILVFLASPSEVAYAEELLSKETAKRTDVRILKLVLAVHFKGVRKMLCQQISVRSIILSSNDLENVITIPSVKYVVDSGLSSESSWEEHQEVIEVKYISQSTAAMRANKAGMKTVGQCYRMYSPDQYSYSQIKGPQERELGLMTLKLYQMGINPNHYNFLETPDQTHLEYVIKELQAIGAVSNDELTASGKMMAALRLEPHLSHLLLTAHKLNVGYPALVLCAISSVAKLFTLPKFIGIVHGYPTGDLLLLIELFQRWMSLKVADRRKLVADNGVDSFVMEVIYDKVLELHDSLKNVGVQIKLIDEACQWKQTLAGLLGDLWKKNLCVLHAPATRTYQWHKTNQHVILLPSCCVRNRPLSKYIVFDKLWKTPWGDFVSNVFPLDDIQEELELDVPLSLSPNDAVLRPIGPHLMRSSIVGASGEKLVSWEKTLRELTACPVSIKAFHSKGTVVVKTSESARTHVLEKLHNVLANGRKTMLAERWEYGLANYPGSRIHWGQTADVFCILMPDEFASVLAVVTESTPLNKVVTTCRTFGRTVHHSEKVTKHGKKQVVVMYETPESARKAINCKEYKVKPMGRRMDHASADILFTIVTATWIRRKNLGTVVIDLKPGVDFAVATVCIATERQVGGCFDEVVILPEEEKNRIVVKRLPQHVSRAELDEAVFHCFAKMPKDTVASISMTQEKAIESTAQELAAMEGQLKSLFSHYEQNLNIAMKQPESKDDVWVATIRFEDENAGQVIIDDLSEGVYLNDNPVHFKLSYQCSVKCSDAVFAQIKNKYISLVTKRQSELGDKKMAVRATTESLPESSQTVVNILGHEKAEVKWAYQEMVKLLESSTVIDLSQCSICDDLFSSGGPGYRFIQQKKKATCVTIALKKKKILIYGKDAVKLMQDIIEFIEVESAKLLSLEPQKVICSSSKGLIRELVLQYGTTLSKLKGDADAYRINLDVKEKTLTVHGDSQAFKKILAAVMVLKSKLRLSETNDAGLIDPLNETCPICLDSVYNAESRYRWEYCGHAYCEPCMAAYIESVTPPIRCLFADCDAPLVFRDLSGLQKIQTKRYPGILARLAEKATDLYMQLNVTQLCYCPLPECEGIARIKSEPQACTRCLNAICAKCNVLYHYGDTCNEFQRSKPTTSVAKRTVVKKLAVPPQQPLPNYQLQPTASSQQKTSLTLNQLSAAKSSREPSAVTAFARPASPIVTFDKKTFPTPNFVSTQSSLTLSGKNASSPVSATARAASPFGARPFSEAEASARPASPIVTFDKKTLPTPNVVSTQSSLTSSGNNASSRVSPTARAASPFGARPFSEVEAFARPASQVATLDTKNFSTPNVVSTQASLTSIGFVAAVTSSAAKTNASSPVSPNARATPSYGAGPFSEADSIPTRPTVSPSSTSMIRDPLCNRSFENRPAVSTIPQLNRTIPTTTSQPHSTTVLYPGTQTSTLGTSHSSTSLYSTRPSTTTRPTLPTSYSSQHISSYPSPTTETYPSIRSTSGYTTRAYESQGSSPRTTTSPSVSRPRPSQPKNDSCSVM